MGRVLNASIVTGSGGAVEILAGDLDLTADMAV